MNIVSNQQSNITRGGQITGRSKVYAVFKTILIIFTFGVILFYRSSKQIDKNSVTRNLEEKKFNKTQFNIYFDSFVTVIKPKVPLDRVYFPISWPSFNSTTPILDMNAVFITSGRASFLQKTLQSFFTFNTYPLKKIIVINDGKPYSQLNKIIQTYQNITWIITNIKVGEAQAMDQAFRHIQTDYYYFSQDDFQYLRSGFIQYCLQSLMYDQKINGVNMGGIGRKPKFQFMYLGPLIIPTFKSNTHYWSFTFWPTTKRMKQYKMLDGGYSGACFNLSYAKGVGSCEPFYSFRYTIKDYYVTYSYLPFYRHFQLNPSPVKFWQEGEKPQEWKNIQKQFFQLQIFKLNTSQLEQKFSYLVPKQQKDEMYKNCQDKIQQQVENTKNENSMVLQFVLISLVIYLIIFVPLFKIFLKKRRNKYIRPIRLTEEEIQKT